MSCYIDGESSRNIASLELVEKLGLTKQPHPCPYYIQWVNSFGKIKVDKIARIEFFIGSYKDCADFDIVPMQACHLLLSKPWISTNNALHNTISNSYSFKYNDRRVTLKPMSAAEILEEDQQRLERRKNEPFRKEWTTSNVATLTSKSELDDEHISLPLVATNTFQVLHKEEDSVKDEEHVVVSGKSFLDVMNCSNNLVVLEPCLDLPLPQVDLSIDPYEKEELCATASLIPLPQQMNKLDVFAYGSPTSAEIKHLILITCETNEQKLLSPLNTLGYVEFDVLCDINTVEKQIFSQTELPLLTRNKFYAIGNYDHRGVFMVHKVYIFSNMNTPCVV